jgi:hypothetical protein
VGVLGIDREASDARMIELEDLSPLADAQVIKFWRSRRGKPFAKF